MEGKLVALRWAPFPLRALSPLPSVPFLSLQTLSVCIQIYELTF